MAARHAPVVVELFTAQGCASCDKAADRFSKLADRDDVVALTWPVDYWDYLGWKDTFARPEFTDRQRAYEKRFDVRDVFTPQVVVDGAAQASGDDGPSVAEAIAKAKRTPLHSIDIGFGRGGRVAIGSAARLRAPADVWLVRYDPKPQKVDVKAGDNRGATVVDRNVVRQLVRLGPWNGRSEVLHAPPAEEPGLAELVLIQGARGGPVIAARRRPGDDQERASSASR
ncbi:MAG TPA: DUF1223 domain-containing protein [Caulobacteraceae bacterium]|nr:DUF1223 domain-containing protein [Caulobacteraceae bacterium]